MEACTQRAIGTARNGRLQRRVATVLYPKHHQLDAQTNTAGVATARPPANLGSAGAQGQPQTIETAQLYRCSLGQIYSEREEIAFPKLRGFNSEATQKAGIQRLARSNLGGCRPH